MLHPVRLGEAQPIGEALAMPSPEGTAVTSQFRRALWTWTDRTIPVNSMGAAETADRLYSPRNRHDKL